MVADQRSGFREQTSAERFTAAYQQLSPSVLGYLRSHGVDDPEAVTNNVFLGLHRSIDRIAGDEEVRTMTFSIAHARLVDHYRSRAARPHVVVFDPESDPRHSRSAEDQAMDGIVGGGALSLLGILGDDQREAVTLRVIAGLTLDETAQVMGKSVGAVKQLQRRALESLRRSLGGRSDHD